MLLSFGNHLSGHRPGGGLTLCQTPPRECLHLVQVRGSEKPLHFDSTFGGLHWEFFQGPGFQAAGGGEFAVRGSEQGAAPPPRGRRPPPAPPPAPPPPAPSPPPRWPPVLRRQPAGRPRPNAWWIRTLSGGSPIHSGGHKTPLEGRGVAKMTIRGKTPQTPHFILLFDFFKKLWGSFGLSFFGVTQKKTPPQTPLISTIFSPIFFPKKFPLHTEIFSAEPKPRPLCGKSGGASALKKSLVWNTAIFAANKILAKSSQDFDPGSLSMCFD